MKTTTRIEKISYSQLKNGLYIAKIALTFYAFFCVFYWFLALINPPFLSHIAFLFEPVFKLVMTFYKNEKLAGVVAALISGVSALVCHLVRDIVEQQEEKANIALKKQHEEDDRRAQLLIQQEYINNMKQYDQFIILVDFNISQIKSYLFDDNMSEEELTKTKKKLMEELFEKINAPYIQSKVKIGNQGFYVIGEIRKTPECLHSITVEIRNLSKKYSSMNITISHDLSFDAISKKTDISEKIEFLQKIIQLNYNNSTLTTSLFKTCYEIISQATMKFTVLGKFQFLIAGKSCNYELYSVKMI